MIWLAYACNLQWDQVFPNRPYFYRPFHIACCSRIGNCNVLINKLLPILKDPYFHHGKHSWIPQNSGCVQGILLRESPHNTLLHLLRSPIPLPILSLQVIHKVVQFDHWRYRLYDLVWGQADLNLFYCPELNPWEMWQWIEKALELELYSYTFNPPFFFVRICLDFEVIQRFPPQ